MILSERLDKILLDIEFTKDYNKSYKFIKGEKSDIDATNGKITISLESGEGAFIIPYHD